MAALKIALAAALAVALAASAPNVAAQAPRPDDGCASVATQTSCESFQGCKWFLDSCVDKPLKKCFGRDRKACNKVKGCKYFNDPAEYIPPKHAQDTASSHHHHEIGCRQATTCAPFPDSATCNTKAHCKWIDGACKAADSQPDPDYSPRCWNAARYRQTCEDLGEHCRWVYIGACENGKCEDVNYGCRHAAFCGFNKGELERAQCDTRPWCQWNAQLLQCRRAPPTESPTIPPTDAPTRPTASPTAFPTTARPTPPTPRPTTGRPTRSPTKAPTKQPTPLNCEQTVDRNRRLVCPNQQEGAYPVKFGGRPESVPASEFCATKCLALSGPDEVDPVWPGCQGWNFAGSQCELMSCRLGGSGEFAGKIEVQRGSQAGSLRDDCFPNDRVTQSPTVSCTYDNEGDPPASTRVATTPDCRLYQMIVSADAVGTVPDRLDWCEAKCTNNFSNCKRFEYARFRTRAECNFFSCTTPGPSTSVDVFGRTNIDTRAVCRRT